MQNIFLKEAVSIFFPLLPALLMTLTLELLALTCCRGMSVVSCSSAWCEEELYKHLKYT